MLHSVTCVQHSWGKKVGIVDVSTGQREMIEFLTLEGSSPIRIHTCLRCVYGENAIDFRSVRLWVRRFKSGETDTDDRSRSI